MLPSESLTVVPFGMRFVFVMFYNVEHGATNVNRSSSVSVDILVHGVPHWSTMQPKRQTSKRSKQPRTRKGPSSPAPLPISPSPAVLDFLRTLREVHAERGSRPLLELADTLSQSDGDPIVIGILRDITRVAAHHWDAVIGEPTVTKHASLASNVVDLVGEWLAHREKTRASVNEVMRELLGRVNFDHVAATDLTLAVQALLNGLPLADVRDISDVADRERQLLAECIGPDAVEGVDPIAQPDEISESDALLMVHTTQACERTLCFDFVQEVRQLPRATRDRVSALLTELDGSPGVPARHTLQTQLVEAILDAGGSRALAEAFILDPGVWRSRYTQ